MAALAVASVVAAAMAVASLKWFKDPAQVQIVFYLITWDIGPQCT